MAQAYVRGYQGKSPSEKTSILACMKHYVGYGGAEGGRDYNTTEIPERLLRQVYLPPFKAGLDAGAATVMSAFNALNGVPASANPFTLDQILRKEWQFKGFVVSDWTAIAETIAHGTAIDGAEAARKSVLAGVDMDMESDLYRTVLAGQVKAGKVPVSSLPALAIATDNVDVEEVRAPRLWDVGFVRRFMVRFGLISSLFDVVTFAFLLIVTQANAVTFRTGWFLELLLTQLLILLIIRTRRAAWTSRPSRMLAGLTAGIAALALSVPYLPGASWFGFEPLPLHVLAGLIGITIAYGLVSEWSKRSFFESERRHAAPKRRAMREPQRTGGPIDSARSTVQRRKRLSRSDAAK